MVTIYRFEDGQILQGSIDDLPTVRPEEVSDKLLWVDLYQPTVEEEERILLEWFNVDHLVLEDMRQADPATDDIHFPKAEEYPAFLFVILRGIIRRDVKSRQEINSVLESAHGGQLNIIMNHNVLITHRCSDMKVVSSVLELFVKYPHYVQRGPDFATAMMLDVTIDHVLTLGELIEERLSQLESIVLRSSKSNLIVRLLKHRRQVHLLQRGTSYQRELTAKLATGNFRFVDKEEANYYRDVLDHHIRASDQLDLARIMVDGLMDLYFSMSSNRLNQIMRILTVISTIFLPITFVTSWYGMNFHHMPELEWMIGYPLVLLIVMSVAGFTLLYSKRRGWLD